MPTVNGLHLAIAIDVLIRISLVLGVGLLLALAARRDSASRHAILVAVLTAAFLLPAAMLTMQALPVPRWPLGWLGQAGLVAPTPELAGRSLPLAGPHRRPEGADGPDAEIDPARGGEVPSGPGADASLESAEPARGPRTSGWWMTVVGRFAAGSLLGALLLGAIVKVAGLGLSLFRLRRIVARARPIVGDRVLSMLALVQRRVPMRRTPRLWESAEVCAPVAAGAIGHHILLPEGWAPVLSKAEMFAVLCHESAHLARRDHRIVILQELLASLLWFHPLVHLFNRVLDRVREEVCDNYAIAAFDRPAYCEALLRLALGRPEATPRGAAPLWSRHWPLEDRIRGILDERRPTRTGISGAARSATAALSAAICCLIALPQLTASRADVRGGMARGDGPPPPAASSPVDRIITKSLMRSFPVKRGETLRFENLAGRVELVPGERRTVDVEATVRVGSLANGETRRLLDAIQWVEVLAEDGSMRRGLAFPADAYPTIRYPVEGETKADSDVVPYLGRDVRISSRRGESIPSVEFDLRISLPSGVRVAVDNAVGPIDVNSVTIPLVLSTRHGAIKLGDVQAPIEATSEFGDVLISRLGADAVVRTGRGGIELSRASRGRVILSTRSGRCRIVQPPEVDFRLHYSGARPIDVLGGGVMRVSSRSGGRRTELLSRGTGGPAITVTSEAGDTVIEPGQ